MRDVGQDLTTRRYPKWNNPDAVYFHGTTRRHADSILCDGIDPGCGAPNTDFGRGFYTTTSRRQAEEWAETLASETGDVAAVLKLTIDRTELARLRNLSFVVPTEDYWRLVERCRDRNDYPYAAGQQYDVINGPVAKRWFGSQTYTIHEGYDQTSFHGETARAFLNNAKFCKVEVSE
jgi:hypothetical protein